MPNDEVAGNIAQLGEHLSICWRDYGNGWFGEPDAFGYGLEWLENCFNLGSMICVRYLVAVSFYIS